MRNICSAATVAFLLALMPAAAQAACPSTGCGYPSIDRAESFAIASNVHGWCGHSGNWWCDGSEGAVCVDKRGAHSLDCRRVDWEEMNVWDFSRRLCAFNSIYTQSDGVWIRYESDGSLSFHWDGYPHDCY